MREHDSGYRHYVIGGVAILIVVVYIIRLFQLQISSDDYKKSADSNAFLKKIEYPSRGVITDRNGKLLVYNQPAYDIMVVMNEARNSTAGWKPSRTATRILAIRDSRSRFL